MAPLNQPSLIALDYFLFLGMKINFQFSFDFLQY